MEPRSRTSPATELPVPKDCLDCTIARIRGHRLCWQHWLEFLRWWSRDRNMPAYRRATPTQRDQAVRGWVGGDQGQKLGISPVLLRLYRTIYSRFVGGAGRPGVVIKNRAYRSFGIVAPRCG
jgi:hypothetical protein